MVLGDIPALVGEGRGAMAALMLDTCQVTRVESFTWDEAQGAEVPATAVVYEGPCWVRPDAKAATTDAAGVVTVKKWPYTVHLPVSAVDIKLDDAVEILTCGLDSSLAGRRLRVESVDRGSAITARRLGCEELAR